MKLNSHLLIVLFVAIIAMLGDIIIYWFNIEYIYAIIISTIVSLVFLVRIICKNNKVSFDFEKSDIFIFLILFIYIFEKSIFKVDNTYDVGVYHIYLQENPFMDKINFDFFPGRIFCAFLFPLGDRMHYIFRYFLGYRLGTVFSYYLVVVLFYQVKKIIQLLNPNIKRPSLYSYIILCIYMYIGFLGSYYIDNIAIIFIMEILYLIFSEKDIIRDNKKIFLIALLSGLAIGVKITSIYFILVLGVYAIIKNIKNLNKIRISTVIIFMLLLIMPYITYIIDNYKQTGSILFPYYNSIFKSEYFGIYNWVEPLFGIDNMLKKIFWPIIVSLQNKAYGDESVYIDPIWAIGYVVLVFYLFYKILRKNKKDKLFIFSLVTMIYTIIWIKFLYGYTRYGVIVVILYCILISSCIYRLLYRNKSFIENIINKFSDGFNFLFNNKISLSKIGYLFCVIIISMPGIVIISQDFDIDNAKYILKDRKNENYNITIDGVWGSVLDNCSYEVLVRDTNTPIYNLEKEYYSSSPKALKMYYEKIKNQKIYMIIEKSPTKSTNQKLYKVLKENNFEIEEVINTYTSNDIPYIDAKAIWQLVKLKYVGEFE